MHIIWVIIIGFLAGTVAKFLMPGKDPRGFILTTCLGIAGALLADFLGRAIGHYGPNDSAGFIASVIGAIIILAVYHWIRRARAG